MPALRFPFRRRQWLGGAVILALIFVAGCRHRYSVPPPVPPPSPSPLPPPTPGHWTEQGIASWYGVPFNGNRAADGEVYNMYEMVAAHRTLPFNSIVRVTDLQNGRQVVVRIIDRGPFVKNRIIDLSFAAARALDMVGPGIAPVRLDLISGRNPEGGDFTVQVGAFAVFAHAERLRRRLGGRWGPVFIQEYNSSNGLLYRVRVGAVRGEQAARRLARQLRRQERFPETFVVRLDR
ncbi:MAG TPA: septal ring lytic transglycosylase RlpA family protein [Patescibacteria group bacterium]|nr:septal ring lytic transglycosylase RlpA family protein [Patescibacteria group bacterium]